MEVFVARQPIFTRVKDIFAYELLYRNNQENQFPNIDGDMATTDVIINSFINIGIEELSDGKPCFINFTEKLLHMKLPLYFQPREIVIEILENVTVNQDLLDICKELKSKGYQIALDDFILNSENPLTFALLELADIIKVDFRGTTEKMRSEIEKNALKYRYKLLAEKVETSEEFDSAVRKDYHFFQGYYFSKPVIVSTHDVPEYVQNYFLIISQLSKSEPDLDYISQLIEQDVSLSFKLLKLINSPAFRPVSKINSIRQAIVRLGYKELKKWLLILSLRGSITKRDEWSHEIFINSLIRAKMCELIAIKKNKREESSAYFLTGMLSLMDTLLGMEMGTILNLIPLEEEITDALMGHSNQIKDALDLCIAIENGAWGHANDCCRRLQVEETITLNAYQESFKWAHDLLKE